MSRDEALLLDVVIAARDARSFVKDLDWPAFAASRLHQNAVIRSLEIIGEAAGKLSEPMRLAHPQVPWREMINMRHRLVHAYDAVRLDIVWAVVRDRLPSVVDILTPLIPPEV